MEIFHGITQKLNIIYKIYAFIIYRVMNDDVL